MRQLIYSLVLAYLIIPGVSYAAPGIPEQFYGTVSGASAGAEVAAHVQGVVVAKSIVANGSYGAAPKLLLVPDPDNAFAGATVSFTVGGFVVPQTAVFKNGAVTKLDLVLPTGGNATAVNTVAQPSQAPAPSVTSLSETQKKFDTNNDGKIDILDFNRLMADWIKKGKGLAADWNRDGVVDLLDFNLLMIHWHS